METDGFTTKESLLLEKACDAVGTKWDHERETQLSIYRRELLRWSERVRLVSRGDRIRVVELHFVDSLRPLPYLPSVDGLTILDLGSGAGFPGVILKIFRPDLRLTLIESNRKKWSFLLHVVRALGLSETEALAVRAGEVAGESSHAGAYGAVVSRALGKLTKVLTMAAPFLAPGGIIIAFKQSNPTSELAEVSGLADRLGFRPPEIASEGSVIKRGSLVLFRRRD